MRSDIIPGSVFPDYELPDHTAKRRKLWVGKRRTAVVSTWHQTSDAA
jgi:hypothetical protein